MGGFVSLGCKTRVPAPALCPSRRETPSNELILRVPPRQPRGICLQATIVTGQAGGLLKQWMTVTEHL